MAKRRIAKRRYPLSKRGIYELNADLEAYKRNLLTKAQELIDALKDVGILEASQRIRDSDGDADKGIAIIDRISVDNGKVTLTLTANGKDIMFIEFGAGIHFNTPVGTSPHPLGAEMGYVIGKYPKGRSGYSLGRLDSWTHNGEETHGTEGTAPMYNAAAEIERSVKDVCRRVFAQ